ncbi:uncharacterized protein LOC106637209 [Copidosoma floridanum]|uniref:uncharacterized protein LOC106637209 n=1 Tax=Copidosoma floridanum TaxID=29053 RepID=UPI0006C9DADE|nr:uncharacterized protein LOC106637209 [Copidosoma floridanum]
MILGFAEDCRKIFVNVKHELILTRSRNDLNAVVQGAIPAANANEKPTWEEFQIQKDKLMSMSFRTWKLYEYPLFPTISKHIWTVKTSNQLEKPRYVVLAFQTNRKNQRAASASKFNHSNIRNVRLCLNSQYYPYGDLNLDMTNNQYALLYDIYDFLNVAPLIVIDCSKQNDSLKNSPVDVRLEFESHANFHNTSACCLILHDRIVQYSPMSGDVKKLI